MRVPLVPVCERLAHRQVCDALDLAPCADKSSIAPVGSFASLWPQEPVPAASEDLEKGFLLNLCGFSPDLMPQDSGLGSWG